MEAVYTSETSVNFNLTKLRYIPEDSILQVEPASESPMDAHYKQGRTFLKVNKLFKIPRFLHGRGNDRRSAKILYKRGHVSIRNERTVRGALLMFSLQVKF
jgi:hypothetical protein